MTIDTRGKPVDLLAKIRRDGFSMSVFALFDVLLVAFMLTLVSSKYILAPGFTLGLDSTLNLPVAAEGTLTPALVDDDVSVLNVRGRGMIFFDGKIYTEDAFARVMQNYKPSGRTLLLKADAGVSAQTLLNIASLAKAAGYEYVQLATNIEQAQ